LKLVRVFLFFLFLGAIAAAQTASLRGRVFDQTGAAVGDAVVLLQGPRGVESTTTAADGTYAFASLGAGAYEVSASAPELATPAPFHIILTGSEVTLDLHLRVDTVKQEVKVDEGDTPAVSTDSSASAGSVIINGSDLNVLGDDPQDLQDDLMALAGPAAGPTGGAIYIDGFSNGQLPPKESIREIRINQNPFAPEYDKLGYGRIEIFTKPGSAKWNGTLGFNYANDFWNSRNPYASGKAPLRLQEYENTFGGPLWHNASFTMDLERHAVDNGAIANGVELDPQTLQPEPFNAIHVATQRHTLVSPHVDYQLTPADTLALRYNFTEASVSGAGIGAFDEASRGYTLSNHFQTAQIINTFARTYWINEARFQYFRWVKTTDPLSTAPAIQVQGAFTSGGATVGQSSDTQNNFEFQDYTSIVRGKHSFRFGARLREELEDSIARTNFNGTFTFSSIDTFQQTQLGTPGYGPSQFSLSAGQPELTVSQFDAGLFWGDEWKLRTNLTLNYGARYEIQTNIDDRKAFAPRVSLAWAPHRTTVLRAGSGIFYDRFLLPDVLTAKRFNGVVQNQYVVTSPKLFPAVPTLSELASSTSPQIKWRQDSALRAPYIVQSVFSLEQQVTHTTSFALTYTNSHGLHELRSLVLGAGTQSPIFQMSSSGLYNQNQLVANFRTKPLPLVSLFGYYVFNRANSNTDGLATFPADPYSESGEYSPAATDIHHRFLAGGSLAMRGHININPYVIAQSGTPFNITTGGTCYGTTLFNCRPGIASSANPGAVETPYGLLDPNPVTGELILLRNFGRGPSQISVNLRAGKSFGFGAPKGEASAKSDKGPQIDAANMSAPGGLRGLFAAPSSDRRYTLTISMSARNLLNHTNPGPIIGDITSRLFGLANQLAGNANMEGFVENASNRRLELQTRFSF